MHYHIFWDHAHSKMTPSWNQEWVFFPKNKHTPRTERKLKKSKTKQTKNKNAKTKYNTKPNQNNNNNKTKKKGEKQKKEQGDASNILYT